MGGLGSGRHYRWGTKETTEGPKSIDVRWIQRKGFLHPGAFLTLSWTRNGEPNGFIRAKVEENQITLLYRFRIREGEWQDVEESVRLTWTGCNFGGKRPWFICPGVKSGHYCGKRVAVLYGAGKYFLCRHCYELTYRSQNESESDRMMRKARKIRERLGASPNIFTRVWKKPKGMHWRTFDRLWMMETEASYRSMTSMLNWLQEMDKKRTKIVHVVRRKRLRPV